jgi:hypothetical protein
MRLVSRACGHGRVRHIRVRGQTNGVVWNAPEVSTPDIETARLFGVQITREDVRQDFQRLQPSAQESVDMCSDGVS